MAPASFILGKFYVKINVVYVFEWKGRHSVCFTTVMIKYNKILNGIKLTLNGTQLINKAYV